MEAILQKARDKQVPYRPRRELAYGTATQPKYIGFTGTTMTREKRAMHPVGRRSTS